MKTTPEEAERPAGEGAQGNAQAGLAYARLPSVRIGAAIALAVGAALLVWVLVTGDDEPKGNARSAQAVSAGDLAALPASVGHPVYWAGPKRGVTYELTRTKDGRVFIRYLPAGVAVGTDEPKYLTVGTYPVKDGVASVRAIAKRVGANPFSTTAGAIAVQDSDHPTSVYLAYPRSPYQIEVFHPSPLVARRLVSSGGIVSVRSLPRPTNVSAGKPHSTSREELLNLSSSLGHPIYWAGPFPQTTLELTRTRDGRTYLRYLPSGVSVGARNAYLTIGTYPVRNGVAAIERIAARPGARRLSLQGGVGVVDPDHPTSVYVAFRGSPFEIEVFDPDPRRARRLVTTRQIAPVR